MTRQEKDILLSISSIRYTTQREVAEATGHSLGIVNRSLKNLAETGYLTSENNLTPKALRYLQDNKPRNAVILAAGYGMRMVPINMETSKAFLEVGGESLIERIVKQLHEVNIFEIYVVVGFMKEQFEYLIDDYGVQLIVNEEYATKNNLHSLARVSEILGNTYIIPCDIWCAYNPFSKNELYSWYMITEKIDRNSSIRINRNMEIVSAIGEKGGNSMIGISYLTKETAASVKKNLKRMCMDPKFDGVFWEEALYEKERMIIQAKVANSLDVVEINTYEQLRDLDGDSNHLKSDAIEIAAQVLNVRPNEIVNIEILKKGMTNRSFVFCCGYEKYIMRIPGEGTEQLINREEEALVYHVIKEKGLCDEVIYINATSGYKITRFLEDVRSCNPKDENDLFMCMKKLREFHQSGMKVEHEFDIFEKIEYYESLWQGRKSIFRDYEETKCNVFGLRKYVKNYANEKVLTHIDAVPDNFLIVKDNAGNEEVLLIDWEYAAMQDPHVDIAMFCIYAMYEQKEVDYVIDLYFQGTCSSEMRTKIYCYIAMCGLLWSNWCEYKRHLGVEFGEYSLRQYRYAKDYYRKVIEMEEYQKCIM